MSPDSRKGRPDDDPTTPLTYAEGNPNTPAGYSVPSGRTYAGPPCGGRRSWCAVVLACPRCGGMHSHRVFEAARLLSGRVTRICPVTAKPYVLSPVQRRKEARRAAA